VTVNQQQTPDYELRTPFTVDQSAWLQHQLTSIMMQFAAYQKVAGLGKAQIAILLEAVRANTDRGDSDKQLAHKP